MRTAAALALGAALGCGGEPPAVPDPTRGLVTELGGAPVDAVPVFADADLSQAAFTLAPTDRVRVLESRPGRDPDTGAAVAVYRVAQGDREGWIAAYWLRP